MEKSSRRNNKNSFVRKIGNLVGVSNVTWVVVAFIIVFMAFIYEALLVPKISLDGESVIFLNYKQKYVEDGFRASFLGNDITSSVKVSGKVDSYKLGTYIIDYFVKHGLFSKKVIRKVIVEDQSAPNIKLASVGDIYVCPGKEYKEEEFQAFDNYDGDITDKVSVERTKNSIVYRVTDSFGNKKEVRRNIFYKDKEKPNLVLEGSEVAYSFVGEEYRDNGYSALDNCDGDITKKVKITGNVNKEKAGEYILTYSVSDNNDNVAKVERKVIVSEQGRNGTIYLTFDDGPKEGTTNVILDILKEEGIKATFFVTNGGPDYLIKRIYDEGHTVALHTASHNYATVYSSVDAYFNDLLSVQDRVKRVTGYESKIIRFPGGSSNTISRKYQEGIMSILTTDVLKRGFRYYDWNLSSGDAERGNHSAEEIKNNVISRLSKDRVNMVLMHDIKVHTRDSLKDIIHYGKENGYTFEAITMDTEMIMQRVNN